MWKTILKPFDIILTILIAVAITLIAFKVYSDNGLPASISIKSESGLSLYPLNHDQHLEVEGPLGKTVIEITGESVRIISSPCRDKLCMLKGTLHTNGDWTACMPNRIYVGIEGKAKEEIDELSY